METDLFTFEQHQQKGNLLLSSLWRPDSSSQNCRVTVYDTGIAWNAQFIPFSFDLRFVIRDATITFTTSESSTSFELVERDSQLWKDVLKSYLNQIGFHEQFKPIKKIGRGNFASVYLVQRILDGHKFAVKAFSKEEAFGEEHGKECLIREIEIMRKLESPSNLKLLEVFQSDNSLYLIFELFTGGQLFQKIKAKQKFRPKQIKIIIGNVLEGLKEMHAKGIMHRDLKPENILLKSQESDECVIADFGLAQYQNSEEYLYVRCGTPGYVAPEVINIKDMTTKYKSICDIFSLGLIFHLLVMGKSLFKGKTYNQVLNENRNSKFSLEGPQYASVDRSIIDLMEKMLKVNPQERISAQEALKHEYFTEREEVLDDKEREVVVESVRKMDLGQSPILTTANEERKKQKDLQRDSCLNFKMGKDNIITGKLETAGTMDSGKMSGFGVSLLKNLKASKFTKVTSPRANT